MNDFEKGFLLGILVGEGHFGGDGLQGQVTVRMHTRHEPLLRWVRDRVVGVLGTPSILDVPLDVRSLPRV